VLTSFAPYYAHPFFLLYLLYVRYSILYLFCFELYIQYTSFPIISTTLAPRRHALPGGVYPAKGGATPRINLQKYNKNKPYRPRRHALPGGVYPANGGATPRCDRRSFHDHRSFNGGGSEGGLYQPYPPPGRKG